MDVAGLADILIATWKVSQPGRNLPSGQGLLDTALKTAIDKGAFPEEFRQLTFVRSPLGIYCPDLVGVLDFANMTLAIRTPNPAYLSATINLSREAAEAILEEHGIARDDALAWGNALAEALDHGEAEEA